jgi:hypothetical protein
MKLWEQKPRPPVPAPAPPPPETDPRPQWGFPSKCPSCGQRGYVDHIDVVDRVMHEHCPVCLTSWEIREEDCVVLS